MCCPLTNLITSMHMSIPVPTYRDARQDRSIQDLTRLMRFVMHGQYAATSASASQHHSNVPRLHPWAKVLYSVAPFQLCVHQVNRISLPQSKYLLYRCLFENPFRVILHTGSSLVYHFRHFDPRMPSCRLLYTQQDFVPHFQFRYGNGFPITVFPLTCKEHFSYNTHPLF